MLYGRKRSSLPAGFYHMQSAAAPHSMYGFGDGEFVRLRDESGEIWQGTVEAQTEDMVRYRFRDRKGRYVSHCHNTTHEDGGMMFRWDIV